MKKIEEQQAMQAQMKMMMSMRGKGGGMMVMQMPRGGMMGDFNAGYAPGLSAGSSHHCFYTHPIITW